MTASTPTAERRPRYEQLAATLSRSIEAGTYPPGSRLPSVRQMSRDQGLSITTILQAYQVLEDRGWIEARPQSGYYVRPRPSLSAPEPALSAPTRPERVRIDDLSLRILHDSTLPDIV
jgi:DNA-binding transcriptional MocR family regulator